jgi:hypothetical protein
VLYRCVEQSLIRSGPSLFSHCVRIYIISCLGLPQGFQHLLGGPISRYAFRVHYVKTFTAILMIALFGLTLGSEVFASHSEFVSCSASGSAEGARIEAHSSDRLVTPTCNESDCADPCHLGQCHLGHCSFSFTDNTVRLHAIDQKIENAVLNYAILGAAVLKGLRRPPRSI